MSAALQGAAQLNEAELPGAGDPLDAADVEYIHADIALLYEFLGVDPNSPVPPSYPPKPPTILCTSRLECPRCPPETTYRSLRRHVEPQDVQLLGADLRWKKAKLYIAHCATCRSDFYPDCFTFRSLDGRRLQALEYDPAYLRISKHGIWVKRRVALAQEHALVSFHAGWSNFAEWVNKLVPDRPHLTNRQSRRLFLEHFSRRLLLAHDKANVFELPAHSSADVLAQHVRAAIGQNGGVLPHALRHGCTECTHPKRFREDLIRDGMVLDGEHAEQVAGLENEDEEPLLGADPGGDNNPAPINPLPAGLPPAPPPQQEPFAGHPRGYVQMAVMDGKTITHRKCALDDCRNPLVDYRSGRFCADHLELRSICGIIPCGREISGENSLTCDRDDHQAWWRAWKARFTRLSYPGVQRVLRRQNNSAQDMANGQPALQVRLPSLDGTPGEEVVHTFRARTTYCLETIQWACGMPVGWGKCYKSESAPQILELLNQVWPDAQEELRPSFIVYDDACDLLRHIVTQDPRSRWLQTTRFIVDAWHYIGHKATDVLCRLWCNPAPRDGSQPDLILVQEDEHGERHETRAFNMETAEQFNAWLNGFEAQMRQMSDVSYDFFAHVLMLLYGEVVGKRVLEKGQELDDQFWEVVEEVM
ncbi:hypothetical protein FKP32DRAFT_1575759 [Trametes sanguinea]|nr:hypothetical protein FKP32DRAFT_1575759 [Trametes sanguinea]